MPVVNKSLASLSLSSEDRIRRLISHAPSSSEFLKPPPFILGLGWLCAKIWCSLCSETLRNFENGGGAGLRPHPPRYVTDGKPKNTLSTEKWKTNSRVLFSFSKTVAETNTLKKYPPWTYISAVLQLQLQPSTDQDPFHFIARPLLVALTSQLLKPMPVPRKNSSAHLPVDSAKVQKKITKVQQKQGHQVKQTKVIHCKGKATVVKKIKRLKKVCCSCSGVPVQGRFISHFLHFLLRSFFCEDLLPATAARRSFFSRTAGFFVASFGQFLISH